MKTSDFDYYLPSELIAQTPVEPRDQSRLMVINRSDSSIKHLRFFEILNYLRGGDVLVYNNSRVIPARLAGRKAGSGGRVEVLLLRRVHNNTWQTLVKPGKRVGIGTIVEIMNGRDDRREAKVLAEVIGLEMDGIKVIRFSDEALLPELGKVPLPPYIHTPLAHSERYQTVYAAVPGSAAAPTAGLHFTPELLCAIKQKGVHCLFVTLHIGLDTFRPVREDDPLKHPVNSEYGGMSQEVARQLSEAKAEGRRIICVGSTSVRIVEQVAQTGDMFRLQPFEGPVSLFILPGYRFRMVDGIITNFHLPKSTLLMMISAFAGRELINRAYQEAMYGGYRFYSFGDAMLVL